MRQHGSEGTSITISARDVVVSLACIFVQSSLDVYEAIEQRLYIYSMLTYM